MKPHIAFHNIRKLSLGPITFFESTADRPSFATRNVTVYDKNGDPFTVQLFADKVEDLLAWDDKAIEVEGVPAEVPPAFDPVTGREIPW